MTRTVPFLLVFSIVLQPHFLNAASVTEMPGGIPIVRTADVVVVGGTVGAVAAAVEASRAGEKVFLIAPRTYLGEDLCATLRLWLEEDESASGELTERMFSGQRVTTPLRVKTVLEDALLRNRVDFLLGCYATDVAVNSEGHPAGVVMANRAGRQAILGKVIIDATDRAVVAKASGAEHRKWIRRKYSCQRIVLGGETSTSAESERRIAAGVEFAGKELFYHEYSLELDLGDGGVAGLAEAEQVARELTYRDGQLRSAERFMYTPTDSIYGRLSDNDADDWHSDKVPSVDRFRPRNLDRVYVLSSAADIPRDVVDRTVRPAFVESLGRTVGLAAAREAKSLSASPVTHTRSLLNHANRVNGVCEPRNGLRPTDRVDETIPCTDQTASILADVDVLVVGGGTSGACAAIGAARQGANVLVVEYQEGLGGVGTVGLIGRPYRGQSLGFTKEVPFCDGKHNNEFKMEWFRRQIRKAGGKIWLGVLGCGAVVEDKHVRGATVATPFGRGVVLADVVIDATGNGDIAVAAGAQSMYGAGEGGDIALQGVGLPLRPLGKGYVNTDYLLVDESDMIDTWRAFVGTRLVADDKAYDSGPFIQTRERRRIVGDHALSYLDQIAGRTYPDSIVLSGSDYDSHGYPSETFFALIPHTSKTLKANHPAPGGTCYTPYRCLLPHGVEGLLVTGLAISMHRDAAAMVRMQKDMHNQGYAAGVAAAMAVRQRCTPRQINVRTLQQHLVEIGNLPDSVLTDVDSFPLPQDQIDNAVRQLTDDRQPRTERCRALAVVLSHPGQSTQSLKRSFGATNGEAKLTYAKILGVLGERGGVSELIDALGSVDAWDAKILQGGMAEYAHLPTPIDALILALGGTRDRRATPAILRKLETLDADVTLSHHRAVALALESLADPTAAEPLARLLGKPGMSGHVMSKLEPLYDRERDKRRRTGPLREIVLARALYRCGDHDGLGERILREYTNDIRGLFARHATAVLGENDP